MDERHERKGEECEDEAVCVESVETRMGPVFSDRQEYPIIEEGCFMERAWWTVRKDRSRGQKMVQLTAYVIWQDYQAEQEVRARGPQDDW